MTTKLANGPAPRTALEYLGYLGVAKLRLQKTVRRMDVITEIAEGDFEAMTSEVQKIINQNPTVIIPAAQGITALCTEIASVSLNSGWFPDLAPCQREVTMALLDACRHDKLAWCQEACEQAGLAGAAGLVETAWSAVWVAFRACDRMIGELEFRVQDAMAPDPVLA